MKSEASHGSSAEDRSRWRTAGELLEVRRYEQVAELLHKVQTASELTGNTRLSHILEAARRICLACSECQADAEYHRRACAEADQREHELGRHLHTILNSIDGRGAPETEEKQEEPSSAPVVEMDLPESGEPEAVEHRGLWQRIQALLGWAQAPRLRAREPPVEFDEWPARPSAEKVGTPAAPSIVKEEERRLASLVVYCLGPFRVYQNDEPITDWDGLKSQSILKYLVSYRGRPISKDILMDVFWPDADPEAARRNLHQAVYCLRQTLRRGQPDFQHIQFDNDCYLLNPEMSIWLDFEEFEMHVQASRRSEAAGQLAEAMAEYGIAEGLYQGDFLEEDLYEDWPSLQREHLRTMCLDVFDRLTKYYRQQGEYTAAIALCQKVLAKDNCREEAHRRLMQCYVAQGQRHLAVRQYQTCVEALKEELDLMPSEETVALYWRITGSA